MDDSTRLCPHCGGNIETELNCSICRVLFGQSKTFRSEDWLRRTPGPATRAILLEGQCALREGWGESPISTAAMEAFLAEWLDTATPPAPDTTPLKSSLWTCCVCGEPVRIDSGLKPWHVVGPKGHEAELSDADRKILADGLSLTD